MPHIALIVPKESYRSDRFTQAALRSAERVTVVTDTMVPLSTGVVVSLATLSPSPEEYAHVLGALADVDAVVGVDEPSVILAARLSDDLGLTSGRNKAVRAATDKMSLRVHLESAEVAQPRFFPVLAKPTLRDARIMAQTLGGFPVVIKPTDCTASRGVLRVDSELGLIDAYNIIRPITDKPLLVEEFLPGEEIAVEGILSHGSFALLVVMSKPDIGEGPTFWETTYLGPHTLSAQEVSSLTREIESASHALGLTDTPLHVEFRRDQNLRFRLLEMAPRTIGGRCAAALEFTNALTLEDIVLQLALGNQPDAVIRPTPFGILMIPTPSSGTLRAVTGQESAREVSGVTRVEITTSMGSTVLAPPMTDRYLGFIFAKGPSSKGVAQSLREAHQLLTIEIDDTAPT